MQHPARVLVIVGAAALTAAGCASLGAPGAPGESAGAAATAEQPHQGASPAWRSVLEDSRAIDGFFRFHQQEDGKLFLELSSDQLDQELGLLMHFTQGVFGVGASAGRHVSDDFTETRLVRFRRVADRVELVHVNPRFTAHAGSPALRSVESNTGHSVAASFQIKSRDSDADRLLVEVTDFFVSDYPDLDRRLRPIFGNTPVSLDRSRSQVSRVQGFPRNVEVDVALTYGATRAPIRPLYGLSDQRSVPVGVRYSLFALPEEPMQPRQADARVGHFITAVADLSPGWEVTPFVRYVNRWRLEKKDHTASVSEAVEPIVLYIDHSVPHEYRSYVREGIEAWNKAFEAAGFRDAVVARDAPEDSTWSPEDIRYSTVRWVAGSVGGYGPSQVDPRTGEILKATSFIGIWDGGFQNERWLRLIEGDHAAGTGENGWLPPGHGTGCTAQLGLAPHLTFQSAALMALDLTGPGPLPEEFFGDALRWLVMHEVGHNLGLYHNFRSASTVPYERLHDRAFTRKYGIAPSVMDYLPPNISPDPAVQGYYWPPEVGAYDAWAIQYSYAPIYEQDADSPFAMSGRLVNGTEAEAVGLRKITDRSTEPLLAFDALHMMERIDPRTSRFSLGDDPLRFSQDRLGLIDRIEARLDRLIAPGEGYESLRDALTSLHWNRSVALAPAMMTIGGLYVERDHMGTPAARPPLSTIPAAEQRRALRLIIDHTLAPGTQRRMVELDNKLVANRWEHWGMPSTMTAVGPPPTLDFPLHDQLMEFQRGILKQLFDPYRLARIIDNETRVGTREEAFSLHELFGTLHQAIWSDLGGRGPIQSFRRNLQRAHLALLSDLVLVETMDAAHWAHPKRPVPGDARALARAELERLSREVDGALSRRNSADAVTYSHLHEVKVRIQRVLEGRSWLETGS
jgi:hypothetical protein